MELSNKQVKILKNISKYKKFEKIAEKSGYTVDEYIDFQSNFPNVIEYMIFSDSKFNEDTEITLTEYANAILDKKQRDSFRFWIVLIISVLAIAIPSIISVLNQ